MNKRRRYIARRNRRINDLRQLYFSLRYQYYKDLVDHSHVRKARYKLNELGENGIYY